MKLQKLLICVLVVLAFAGHHAASQNVVPVAVSRPSPVAIQDGGVRVSGQLFNVEGAPYNDPTSRAVLRIGNGIAGVSNIGADGFFEFTRISPGNYSLSLSGRGVPLSPIIPVRVANTDVRNLEMVVSRAKQVNGQATLDGSGPLPLVRLLLKPVNDPTANPAIKALSPSGFVTNDAFAGLAPITPMLDISPRPDGTFVVKMPDGDWNVTVYGGLPAGYAIQALTYGTVDVLRGPLRVRLSDNATIRFVVSNSTNRLSKVYGRITGLTPQMISRGPMSVSLRGPMSRGGPVPINTQPRTAAVRADGTFEIDEVLPGDYSVMVTGLDTLDLAGARLAVTNADVRDFEIEILRREIRGKVIVEGGGPMVTALTLSFKEVQEPGSPVGGFKILNAGIRPLPDGTFTALLPEEEQLVNTGYGGAPCGYKLRSLIYGATDVLKLPLKVLKAYTSELQITLTYSECVKR